MLNSHEIPALQLNNLEDSFQEIFSNFGYHPKSLILMKIFVKSSILLKYFRISIKILRLSPICLSGILLLVVAAAWFDRSKGPKSCWVDIWTCFPCRVSRETHEVMCRMIGKIETYILLTGQIWKLAEPLRKIQTFSVVWKFLEGGQRWQPTAAQSMRSRVRYRGRGRETIWT